MAVKEKIRIRLQSYEMCIRDRAMGAAFAGLLDDDIIEL